jgi:Glycosyl transferase family 2
MDVKSIQGHVLLGAIRQGTAPEFRAIFASGNPEPAFEPRASGAVAIIDDIRGVSGGVLVTGRDSADAVRISTSSGDLTINPKSDERGLFAGRDVLLAFRLEEPAARVAEWLSYHATHHGAGAALIINRAPPTSGTGAGEPFAKALQRALAATALPPMVVVVLEPGSPLGKDGMPAENHVSLAPDAPGKDRMTRPADDPWLAPLGQELVLELCKWRFLADARAVLFLDVSDLLAPRPRGAPTAFDLCIKGPKGVVGLTGTHIYPWRKRVEAAPQFGDHICHLFDTNDDLVRWGVAPQIAGLEKTWRFSRISYAKPDPGQTIPFWRAMAIRIAPYTSAPVAPKAALVEDPALLAMAHDHFGYKPVRMPAAKVKRDLSPRTCIVTTMKNEGPFILEWLAYHRAIGVDDVLVYTNDCSDGTDTMLAMLQTKGLVQHRQNPWRPGTALKPQHAALQAAEAETVVQDAGWVICMDVDEFINIKLGDGRLPSLYAAMEAAHPGANMISLTWRLFGNGDAAAFQDRFITEQFDLCAQELIRKPHQAWGFKTLFRNLDVYRKMGVHRPKGLTPSLHDAVKWLNGSGRPMPAKMLRNGWRSSLDTYGYDWV